MVATIGEEFLTRALLVLLHRPRMNRLMGQPTSPRRVSFYSPGKPLWNGSRQIGWNWKPEAGTTLTELIIVIIFLGIALTSILLSFRTGLRSTADSGSLNLAAQLAEAKMEQIKSDKAAYGYDYLVSQNYPEESDADGFSGYVRTVTITDYSDYKKVEVQVTHGNSTPVKLVTLFANY